MCLIKPATEKRLRIAISTNDEQYSDWVVQNGGDADLLGTQDSLDGAAGLLLTGGEDVDPGLYGETNRHCQRVNPLRDRFELGLLQAALIHRIPILAICRGMQLLAVALGGSLYQDLSERVAERRDLPEVLHRGPDHSDTVHRVTIEQGSLLADCLGKTSLETNSHHHQGVRTLPGLLRASAYSDDGLIEAMESTGNHWILGLQWHPERCPDESSASIMRRYLDAAAAKPLHNARATNDFKIRLLSR